VAGRVHVLHLDDLEFELMRGVEREDDVFTVIGADPQMAFRIPEWEEPVEALSLRGWAR
jgi:hypothetical protein